MNVTCFDHRSVASAAAAERISTLLQKELATSDRASFVASGGDTPKACYRILSETDLAWDRVDVVPSDERNVEPGHEMHNGTMICNHLVHGKASALSLHSLDEFDALAKPTTVALLGVGEDGHFASIFRDIPEFQTAVDLQSAPSTLGVVTQASSVPRTTLSLKALCDSKNILLLAFGEAKREVLEHPEGLPIHHLLAQDEVPVEIFWSP
jgi:6-phosphogluconolactonase